MFKEFLDKRKNQEKTHFENTKNSDSLFTKSLITVEINTNELCNRKCVFCPRVDPKIYPNRNLHIEISTIKKIAKDLKKNNFNGRVSFSGFGEPLLHKNFKLILSTMRSYLPNNNLETNTNGDKLNSSLIRELFSSGLSNMYINCYDNEDQVDYFEKMINESGIDKKSFFIRPHWEGYHKNFGLFLNNRSGMIMVNDNEYLKPLNEPYKKKCFYPFYKLLIDYNGDALFCSNDWGRKIIVGNVLKEDIKDIWLGEKLNNIRKKLANKDRSHSPCNTCSIDGEMHGQKSFNYLNSSFQFENVKK